ncbi:hypothetical protein T02_12520 [Trichinella nativa]|uniref:Uncharacterized protein n=1 Tax=Trichinella nativa TaxID=6335 RepID=A0A0V1L844_9BILA|nr:hypothetical protein T02_12520 [Trichinella nativa]
MYFVKNIGLISHDACGNLTNTKIMSAQLNSVNSESSTCSPINFMENSMQVLCNHFCVIQTFCRGLELHIKRDESQPKGGANLVKSHVSSLIS